MFNKLYIPKLLLSWVGLGECEPKWIRGPLKMTDKIQKLMICGNKDTVK